MPYIGVAPSSGLFKKLDAISVSNGVDNYTMQYNGSNYKPATANALLVSVNGVIQAAGDAYDIDGSTITFTENLVTGDTIDFIIALGDTGSAVTPVDGSVTTAKLANDAVTMSKLASSGTLPALNGSALTNISGALTGVSAQSASGSSTIDFTGIPSGVNLIKFTSWGVSASAAETLEMRIGDSDGFETTGYGIHNHYANDSASVVNGGNSQNAASWKNYNWGSAANTYYMRGELVHAGSNRWVMEARFFFTTFPAYWSTMFGYKELSGELDRVRFYVASGTFDAGTFRIMYE